MEQLQINMLGEFSLCTGENRISSSDNRSRKVWSLLAYLICRRRCIVTPGDLIRQIWGESSESDNPENTLKVTMHRVRNLLDKLWPNAGRELIVRRGGGYIWNPEIPITVDVERFENHFQNKRYFEALALYKGEFLSRISEGAWVIPIATHYHNIYIHALLEVLPQLANEGKHTDVVALCRAAISVEPYNEPLYQYLMESLLAMEDKKGAAAAYETLRGRLMHDFGITPSQDTRAIYRKASESGDWSMPVETVLAHLMEEDPAAGALQCDFDCFKVLCHVESRAMLYSGRAVHVALLSVSGVRDTVLSKRSLERAMENLSVQIRLNLRRGDAFSKCSSSQFVILLSGVNYENSCVVCQKVINAFCCRHPHSPTQIHYIVQPLSLETPET